MEDKISFFISRLRELPGKAQESLSRSDIRAHFSGIELDDDQMNQILSYLGASGISIIDDSHFSVEAEKAFSSVQLSNTSVPKESEDAEELKEYLELLTDIQELDEEESLVLSRKAAFGDQAARKTLTEQGLKLVYNIASELYDPKYGIGLYELIQEGNMALMLAAEKFSSKYNLYFYTYASYMIRQSILKSQALARKNFESETDITAVLNMIIDFIASYKRDYGHEPTAMDVAAELSIPLGRIRELQELTDNRLELSDSDMWSDDSEALVDSDMWSDDSEALVDSDMWSDDSETHCPAKSGFVYGDNNEIYLEAIPYMTSFEAKALSMRYGLSGESMLGENETCRRLGISSEHLRHIRALALYRIRKNRAASSDQNNLL